MTLVKGDLVHTIKDIFEIDAYQSKMGDDANIVTLSFSLTAKEPAEDLEKFLESGYDFILDSDVTSGEQSDGMYKVFVELARDKHANESIMKIMDGVAKLADLTEWKFRYYKGFRSHDLNIDNLNEHVPLDSDNYGVKVNENNLENYKNFFNKSYIEESSLIDNILTLKKAYADPIQFKVLDFGNKTEVLEGINESFNVDDFAEIIFLSKYIGDYNITKYGHKLTFENKGNTLVLERL